MIELQNINKFFGNTHVLKEISLRVKEGEKLVILGPSGSGKSTTIRCINFLEEPTSGKVFINGEEMTKKNKTRLVKDNVAMVFQQFNLYPHKTVLENLTLAPPSKPTHYLIKRYIFTTSCFEFIKFSIKHFLKSFF
ncbi:ATP-binding cassette domain-containing protein [Thomasclavelia ramosa]|uniref:ATP-binding cassette domain-containing protein n=1 Tax=Thomasclavelia ramosa TaxID=1547 RepID=UPI0034A2495B